MASNPLATASGSQLLANIPALAPPEGVIPDFEHPANHISIAVVWGSIELALMLFFYTIRVYNKCFITKKFTWDDCNYPLNLPIDFSDTPYSDMYLWSCETHTTMLDEFETAANIALRLG